MKIFKFLDTFLLDGFYVTQNYFARPSYYAQFNLLGHEGVDFGHANKKVQIRTPLGGTVFVSTDPNYGKFAVIENYIQRCAIYLCHMENIIVESGEEVVAGEVIGEMDDTGNSSGEHCHLNFSILNEQGNDKYHTKAQNWGFLDPRYPRDTGNPVTFAGVEEYSIEWTVQPISEQPGGQPPMANMYKGYDLANPESMKAAVDVLVRVQAGEFVDKPKYDKDLGDAKTEADRRVDLAKTAEREATVKTIASQVGLPESITTTEALVTDLKRLISQSNNGNGEIGSDTPQLPNADKLRLNGVQRKWVQNGIETTLNYDVKE